MQWRQRYTLVRAGGDTAPLQDSNPILLSYTGEGTTATSFLTAHYSSLELVEDSRFLRHLRGEAVPLHLLPPAATPPSSPVPPASSVFSNTPAINSLPAAPNSLQMQSTGFDLVSNRCPLDCYSVHTCTEHKEQRTTL